MKKGDQLGRFTVLEDLGAGGMGEVFLARDEKSGRDVALKVLHANYVTDANLVPRFVREAETYRRLRHPNIVGYVASGVHESTYFIAMEHVDGSSLEKLLEKSQGPLGLKRSMLVVLDLLRALRHAHEHGVVHRDLKPQNVMVSREGAVKLLDFGLARAEDALLETRTGDMLGSFRYSAPEQNAGTATDHRSDLYAVGLILYEGITGSPALDGSFLDVRRRQKAEEFRSPSSLVKEVPPALDSICRRFLRHDPGGRFQSAQEALDELKEFQEDAGLG